MNMRKITSMTLVWSLIVLIFNSVILYIVPEGRVSNWAAWHFWGLDKHEWAAQHINVGVLFCLAGILHIYYNWKPIISYMKNSARHFRLFTPASAISFILTALFVIGTFAQIPPFSSIIDFSEQIKISEAQEYGEPPYGQAQSSSLSSFSARLGLDLEKSKELLTAEGVEIIDDQEMIQSIAARSKMSPQEVYEIIKPALVQTTTETLNDSSEILVDMTSAPQSGMGRKTITEICDQFATDCQVIIDELKKQGLNAAPEMKIKDLAADNGLEPMQIYEKIEAIATGVDKD
jgi:hypothetical protein